MNYFAQYENPGEFDHYDEREDPRGNIYGDINVPDYRGIQYRLSVLETVEDDVS